MADLTMDNCVVDVNPYLDPLPGAAEEPAAKRLKTATSQYQSLLLMPPLAGFNVTSTIADTPHEAARNQLARHSHLVELPEDISIHILRYLDLKRIGMLTRLCKSFSALLSASSQRVWRAIHKMDLTHTFWSSFSPDECFAPQAAQVVEHKMLEVVKRCRFIEHLSIDIPDLSLSAIKEIAKNMTRLKVLEIHDLKHFNDHALKLFGKQSPELTSLSLKTVEKVSDVGMLGLLTHCNKLEHVSLSCGRKITNVSLAALADLCSVSLQSVKLDIWHAIEQSSFRPLLETCKNLRHLCVQFGVIRMEEFEGVQTNIESIELKGCHMHQSALRAIMKNCKRLKRLALKKFDETRFTFVRHDMELMPTIARIIEEERATQLEELSILPEDCTLSLHNGSFMRLLQTCCLKRIEFGEMEMEEEEDGQDVWQSQGSSNSLSQNVDIFADRYTDGENQARFSGSDRVLHVQHHRPLGDVAFSVLADRSPHLVDLILGPCSVTTAGVYKVLSGCPQLKTLFLSSDGIHELKVTSKSLQKLILPSCKQITTVDIACPNLLQLNLCHALALTRLTIWAPNLESLDVVRCLKLSELTVDSQSLRKMDALMCTALTNLNLACPSLEIVNLEGCTSLTAFSSDAKRFTYLYFAGCVNLKHIAVNSPSLKVLDASGCTQLTTGMLHCDSMVGLKLDQCPSLEHVTVHSNSLQSLSLSNAAALKELAVTSSSMSSLKLSNARALSSVSVACPSLKNLSLTCCESLQRLSISTCSLSSLSLEGCLIVSDDLILHCLPSLAQLQILNLRWCEQISDISLIPLVGQAPSLRDINLAHCRLVSNETLAAIGASCTSLCQLSLDFCSGIDLTGLNSLNRLSNLEMLKVRGCPRLLSEDLPKIEKIFDDATVRILNVPKLG
eukprot:GILK01007104.1.p1 GENE.GILK01007104.1~~GILK01007104.1.p1  ORF type:complete len:907 (+),score=145.81 GILK01007104.1:24-2723(+)